MDRNRNGILLIFCGGSIFFLGLSQPFMGGAAGAGQITGYVIAGGMIVAGVSRSAAPVVPGGPPIVQLRYAYIDTPTETTSPARLVN